MYASNAVPERIINKSFQHENEDWDYESLAHNEQQTMHPATPRGGRRRRQVSDFVSGSLLSPRVRRVATGVGVTLLVSGFAAVMYTSINGPNSTNSASVQDSMLFTSSPASAVIESETESDTDSTSSSVSTSVADALLLSAADDYGDTSANKFPYPFLTNSLLATPYKTTTFTVSNPAGSDCVYNWVIRDTAGQAVDKGKVTDGSNAFSSSNLKSVGQYTLSVAESDCAGTDTTDRTVDTTLWVKYVRRELTTLTDEDRETFLDAFATLWQVNTVDGQQLYGENYKSLYYFASIHNDGGANSVCDEFHGNQGFVNNHLMLGAYLEQSLQLVDPSTCLHYMEYASYFTLSGNFASRKLLSCFRFFIEVLFLYPDICRFDQPVGRRHVDRITHGQILRFQ
jgi:hypothetical protein